MELKNRNPVKVLLADDHLGGVLAGYAMFLSSYGITVVGEARTPDEAMSMYEQLSPDVLVLDIRFGHKLTGFDVAKELLKRHPDANIVFLSQFDQDSLIKEAYKIGARSFITKDSDSEKLATAVSNAAEGSLYFLPEIAERLANLSVRGDNSPRSLLDPRELEVFVLMAQGRTNAEMASDLNLSSKTISNISHTIKGKLGIQRIADLTLMAVRHRLIEP